MVAGESVRIARSIPAFVMAADNRKHAGEIGDRLHYGGAFDRVRTSCSNSLPWSIGPPAFAQHIVVDADFADVM